MSVNIRNYVSNDHIESIGEIAKSQSAIIQALSLDNSKLEEENKQLKSQLQQKENIIKEVREYIEMHTPSDIGICGNKTKRYYTLGEDSVDHILEILDGENNDK